MEFVRLDVTSFTYREVPIVSCSGGGGSVSGGSGLFGTEYHVKFNPVDITTNLQCESEIWGRKQDGHEVRFRIPGVNLPVREGHKIVFLQADGRVMAVKNYTTGNTTVVSIESIIGPRPRMATTINTVLGCGIVASICAMLGTNWYMGLSYHSGDDTLAWCIVMAIVWMPLGCLAAILYSYSRHKKKGAAWISMRDSWQLFLSRNLEILAAMEF